MPGVPLLLIVPDLNILVSDPNRYQYAPNQLLVFFAIFDQHNQAILAEKNVRWCLSQPLLQRLLSEFPWRLSQQPNQLIGPLNTVLTAYLPVLQRAVLRNPGAAPAVIIPADFLGTRPHAQQTRDEWLKLMSSSSTCWQERQPSFDGMLVTSRNDDILVIHTPDQQPVCRIDVIGPITWAETLQWAKASLPRTGSYAYRPARGRDTNFPSSRTREGQEGVLDADGNIWCWDLMHRDHWDVIDNTGNRLRRVRPDGRLFP